MGPHICISPINSTSADENTPWLSSKTCLKTFEISHLRQEKNIFRRRSNFYSVSGGTFSAEALCIFISPITSASSFSTSIAHLLSVVNQISQWMSSNLLCLNPSKTEFILIGLTAQIKKIPDSSIRLSNNSSFTTFISDAPVRNLGVNFDPHLSFSNHIANISRSCFMHIRDLRRIRHMLDFKTASTIATSIVHSKLDYCNSLFLNLDSTQIQRLQLIQN